MHFSNEILFFGGFIAFIVAVLLIDLLLIGRKKTCFINQRISYLDGSLGWLCRYFLFHNFSAWRQIAQYYLVCRFAALGTALRA